MDKDKDKAAESYEVQYGPAFNHAANDRYEAMGFGSGAKDEVKSTIAETAIKLVRIVNGSGRTSEDVEAAERLILSDWKLRRLIAIGLLNGGINATRAMHEVIQGTKNDSTLHNPLAALLGR